MPKMRTSVIIPFWIFDNVLLNYSIKTIQCLRESSDVELVVVNNGSTLGNDFLEDSADIYIHNYENLGFTKAVNQGLVEATGDYIVIGNDDYFVEKGWEPALVSVVDEDPRIATATPCVRDLDIEPQQDVWAISLPGSWFMMKRNTLDKIGLYDEQFKNIFSDTDFSNRVYRAGMIMTETSRTKATHIGSATINRIQDGNKEYFETRDKFIDKWKEKKDE